MNVFWLRSQTWTYTQTTISIAWWTKNPEAYTQSVSLHIAHLGGELSQAILYGKILHLKKRFNRRNRRWSAMFDGANDETTERNSSSGFEWNFEQETGMSLKAIRRPVWVWEIRSMERRCIVILVLWKACLYTCGPARWDRLLDLGRFINEAQGETFRKINVKSPVYRSKPRNGGCIVSLQPRSHAICQAECKSETFRELSYIHLWSWDSLKCIWRPKILKRSQPDAYCLLVNLPWKGVSSFACPESMIH